MRIQYAPNSKTHKSLSLRRCEQWDTLPTTLVSYITVLMQYSIALSPHCSFLYIFSTCLHIRSFALPLHVKRENKLTMSQKTHCAGFSGAFGAMKKNVTSQVKKQNEHEINFVKTVRFTKKSSVIWFLDHLSSDAIRKFIIFINLLTSLFNPMDIERVTDISLIFTPKEPVDIIWLMGLTMRLNF